METKRVANLPGYVDSCCTEGEPMNAEDFRRWATMSPEATARLTESLNAAARSVEAAVASIKPALDRMGKALAAFAPPSPPEGLRERALHAQQHRNTGPVRDPYKKRGMK